MTIKICMKYKLLLHMALFCLIITPMIITGNLVSAQEEQNKPVKVKTNEQQRIIRESNPGHEDSKARITFDTLSINLGKVSDLEIVPFEYHFTNTGTETLIVEKVKSGCRCTVAELDKKEYAPGESGVIKASYNPTFRRGKETKFIDVLSNDGEKAFLKLIMNVEVDPVVKIPDSTLVLNDVIYKKGTSATFLLTTKMKKIEIKNLDISGPYLSWKILKEETAEKPDGSKQIEITIELTIDPDAPMEPFRRAIEAHMLLTDQNDQIIEHQVNFSVIARIIGDIKVNPSRVAVGRTTPHTEFTKTAMLTSLTGTEFKITDIKHVHGNLSTDPGEKHHATEIEISYEILSMPGIPSMYKVTIHGYSPTELGPFYGTVIVKTNIDEQPESYIRYSGNVIDTK